MPREQEKPRWLQAREPVVVIVGARAPVYRKVVVRDRHTGRLAEVPLAPCEAPPLDPGDEGKAYGFRAGERVLSDHPAVGTCPGAFIEEDQLGPPSAAR